jgi:hypothetical protein
MATAAAVTARRNAKKKGKGAGNTTRASFHLQLHLGEDVSLPKGQTSIGLLRSPLLVGSNQSAEAPEETAKSHKRKKSLDNLIGTRFEVWAQKFNNKWEQNQAPKWQERLLIVTERRIFLASKEVAKSNNERSGSNQPSDKDLEIVDSIPMEEIISVELNDGSQKWTPVFVKKPPSLKKTMQEWFQNAAEFLNLNIKFKQMKNEQLIDDARGMVESTEHNLSSEEIILQLTNEEKYFGSLIRVVTDPEGFNRGYPFYFSVKKNSYVSWKGTVHWRQARDGISRSLSLLQLKQPSKKAGPRKAEDRKVARRLKKLATKRRLDFKRETRFLRFQAYLQGIWNSKRLNIVVLFLIVSNFILTVQQLENNDPSRQRYFEDLDLAYTIIFSIGDALLAFDAIYHFLLETFGLTKVHVSHIGRLAPVRARLQLPRTCLMAIPAR